MESSKEELLEMIFRNNHRYRNSNPYCTCDIIVTKVNYRDLKRTKLTALLITKHSDLLIAASERMNGSVSFEISAENYNDWTLVKEETP